MIDNSVVLATY